MIERARLWRLAAGYAVAALVGLSASLAQLPLAWMLGPLFATAVLSIIGLDIQPFRIMRRFGQACIGTGVGLNMSASLAGELVGWLPIMIATAAVSVLVSTFVAAFFSRATSVDLKTAFFANIPGGLSEMGNIGSQMGARTEPIAVVQTLRVALVVMIVPPLLVALGAADHRVSPAEELIPSYLLPLLLLGGAAVALILGLLRLNNPVTVGAIIFTGTLASLDLVHGRVAVTVTHLAQFLLGAAIGCQFRRDMFRHMPIVRPTFSKWPAA